MKWSPFTVPQPAQTLLVALVVAAGTHWLDQRNWRTQHQAEREDVRRQDAERVFDTTTVSLSRIGTSMNALLYGIQQNVSRDSVNKLSAIYSRNVYAFENQSARLESLIKVYFDQTTLYQFTSTMSLVEAAQLDAGRYLNSPAAARPRAPEKMREFMLALFTLSDHMAQQLARDST